MTKSLRVTLEKVNTKAENIMDHIVCSGKEAGLLRDEHIHSDNQIVCFDCIEKVFFYMQMCTTCIFSALTFYLHHFRPASQSCDVSCYSGSISQRFGKKDMSAVTITLTKIAQNNLRVGNTFRRSKVTYWNKRRKLNRALPSKRFSLQEPGGARKEIHFWCVQVQLTQMLPR